MADDTSLLKRPSLALANLSTLDVGAAGRALFSPESLSPHERRSLAQRWGFDDGLARAALDTVTDPLVLLGLVLTTRFPILNAKSILSYSQKVSGYQLKHGPIMRRVAAIDEMYRGTEIPELYKGLLRDVFNFKQRHMTTVGTAIAKYQQETGQPFDLRSQIKLAAKLDGLDDATVKHTMTLFRPIQLTPAETKVYEAAKSLRENVWNEVFGTKEARSAVARATILTYRDSPAARKQLAEAFPELFAKGPPSGREMKQIFSQLRSQSIVGGNLDVDNLRKYFPHQLPRDMRTFDVETQAMLEGAFAPELEPIVKQMIERAGGAKRYGEMALASAERVGTGHALKRMGHMIPDPRDLEHVQELLTPGSLKKVQQLAELSIAEGAGPRLYSLRYTPVIGSFVHSMGRAYGWTVKGYGPSLVRATEKMMKADPARGAMLKDSYIPIALGRLSYKQSLASLQWANHKVRMIQALENPEVSKVFGATGMKGMQDWLKGSLLADRGPFSLQNVSGKTAGYLYLSALGGNPASASLNMMQLLLTTIPTIGPKYTLEGLKRVLSQARGYFDLRKRGLNHEQTLAKLFPEFAEQGLVAGASPVSDEALAGALSQAWDAADKIPSPVLKGITKTKAALMSLFQASENMVRLTTFQGSYAKALAEGNSPEWSSFFARRVTEMTQFLGGPASRPASLLEANPVLSQFLQFPQRTLEFLMGPGTTLGSGAQATSWGRNYGTLGRAVLTSALAYHAADEILGADVSRGLISGALPAPFEGAPLYPFPFVPPAVSIAAAAGSDVLRGEVKQIKRVAPLMVPGGMALARATTAYAPGVAEALGRSYADWKHPAPDGRIPVYTSGGTLRGHFTPWQLHAMTLGIVGTGEASAEEARLARWVLSNRDRIRGYRREYLNAIVDGDARQAERVNEAWEKAYPQLGPIQLKPTDWRAVELRRNLPRLHRLLQTMPAEVRGQFRQIINTALAEEATGLLGMDPALLGAPRSQLPGRSSPPVGLQAAPVGGFGLPSGFGM